MSVRGPLALALLLLGGVARAAPAKGPARASAATGDATAPAADAPASPAADAPAPPAASDGSLPPHHREGALRGRIDERFWKPGWRRVSASDYGWTAGLAAHLAVEGLVLQPRRPELHFQAPLPGDQQVRAWLRSDDPTVFRVGTDVSWVLMIGLIVYPAAVDVPVAWARGGRYLAWELLWEDMVTLGAATVLDLGLRDLTGRARPWAYDCLTVGHPTGIVGTCDDKAPESNRSFPGGHFAVSTAAAALLCTQHLETHLYGGAGDALVCGSALVADVTVGVLRVVTDEHWASDILAGGLLGSAVGVLVPLLIHYHLPPVGGGDRPTAILAPTAIGLDHGAGLGLTGVTF